MIVHCHLFLSFSLSLLLSPTFFFSRECKGKVSVMNLYTQRAAFKVLLIIPSSGSAAALDQNSRKPGQGDERS